jgi:hypothetical protein
MLLALGEEISREWQSPSFRSELNTKRMGVECEIIYVKTSCTVLHMV